MAHSKSAKKRIRQNERSRMANKATKSSMRTSVKKVEEAIEAGDREAADREFKTAGKELDKAAKTNVIHKNQAARRKSRLQKAVNKVPEK